MPVIVSDWDGPMGDNDFAGGLREGIPNSIARLSTNLDPRNYDLSGMGPGEEDHLDVEMVSEVVVNQTVRSSVSDLSLAEFRSRLVKHFDIKFHSNEIVWPSRTHSN